MSERVAILQLFESLRMGGAENYGVQLSNYLMQTQRYQIHVAYGPGERFWRLAPGIQLHQYNIHRGQNLLLQLQDLQLISWFRRIIRQNHIRLLHYYSFTAPLYASIAAQSLGIPTVYTPMSVGACGLVQRLQYPKYSLLNRAIDRLVDRYIALSEYLKYEYEILRAVPKGKVVLNWLGVDISRFVPTANKADLRRKLNWPVDKFICIVAARLHPSKRIHLVLEAFAHAFYDSDCAELRIFGSGPLEDELKAHTRRLGISKQVFFCGSSPNMAEIYPAADAHALTTFNPNMGLAALESMACGVTQLTYTDDGNPLYKLMAEDTVIDGYNGYHVNTVTDMAEKMVYLMRHPDLCATMGQRCREIVEEKFNMLNHYCNVERLYADLIT